MIIFKDMLKQSLKEYSNVNAKISNDIKKGKLFRVKRGLYETDKNTPSYYLAQVIYGPSYISFDFALSHYGLIPERAYTVTNATFNKKKRKMYNTPFGTLIYRDVPQKAFPYGVTIVEEKGYVYHIATPEKAICDKLYIVPPVKNQKELEYLLFEDLRIDDDEFEQLNMDDILILTELYNSTNLKMLGKYIRRHML